MKTLTVTFVIKTDDPEVTADTTAEMIIDQMDTERMYGAELDYSLKVDDGVVEKTYRAFDSDYKRFYGN